MAMMDAMNGMRDRHIVKRAYKGTSAAIDAAEDREHVKALRAIGKTAAEEGLTLAEAYHMYDEYMEHLDAAYEEETEMEGDDPQNIEDDDEEL